MTKPAPVSTATTSQDLREINLQEFAELASLFRDDDFNTVAQAGHLDIVKKTNSDLKATNNTIRMDTKENFSCRGMFSFNPHFSDNCNVTININNYTN